MEANELKATDLMVGDWIMFNDKPCQVKGLHSDDSAFLVGYKSPYFLIDAEPIPLTPEILEKNEFEKNISNTRMRLDTYEYTLIYDITDRLFTIFNEIYGTILVQKSIVNVHELQHILRLCKIDKEIVV